LRREFRALTVHIEYKVGNACFDLVALEWPSTGPSRGHPDNYCRLAIIEMKYSDIALDGNSGINTHIKDVEKFLSNTTQVNEFKKK